LTAGFQLPKWLITDVTYRPLGVIGSLVVAAALESGLGGWGLAHTGVVARTGSLGWVVVLNGAPRSGKSSIVKVIQETFEGPWMNLGVDVFHRCVTPPRYRPGMGLRPGGGERTEVEALIPALYAAFYDSVAAHSRQGLNVVVDVGHHDAYSTPLRVLPDAARRLRGLPAWLVGVRCPIEVIMARRDARAGGQ
jgi:chloramphenicol 3-O phosphotransferase